MGPDTALFLGKLLQASHIYLNIEMPRVGKDHPIFHFQEMTSINYVDVSSSSDENIANLSSLCHGHHSEPIHHSF